MSTPEAAPPPKANIDLRVIAGAFVLRGDFGEAAPYGSGHINDTYAVRVSQAGAPVRYILQRVNEHVFRNVPAVMENIERVTAHAALRARAAIPGDASRRTLTIVRTRDGAAFHHDAQGGCWRCYLFIEGARTYDRMESPRHALEAARAIGEFQRLLVDLPGARLHETIPNFHHTRSRFETFKRVLTADPMGRAAGARPDVDFALAHEPVVDVLLDLQARGEMPERVTHNDTKINNVMLDDATGEGVCVIDLDTVMPGLALYDFGDMVRSGTNAAEEDERDLGKVAMRMDVYEGLATGYAAAAGRFLCESERAHLAFAGKLITFEIGLRFLTDYLEGDVYFKIKRPRHNLDRCRNQFALVRSIEQQESAMQQMAERILKKT